MQNRLSEHRGLILASLLVVAFIVAGFVFQDEFFGGDESEQADARSSQSSPTVEDRELPSTSDAPRSSGAGTPEISLGDLIELRAPVAVVDPSGSGPVLVATLGGRVHSVDLDSGTSEVVLDIGSLITTGGERGLLGMAMDPAEERLS